MELSRSLQPVILGGDVGAYSLARAFHEAYGVRSIVIATAATGLVRNSVATKLRVVENMDNHEVLVETLRSIAGENPKKDLIALGSADWLVRALVENRASLEDLYTIPYVDQAKLDLVTEKGSFSELCATYGLAHPKTVVHRVGGEQALDVSSLRFPVIAKTGNTAAYHEVEFPGKKKVFTAKSDEELRDIIGRVEASGYRDDFIIQDFIPGDDSGMRILTCYSDKQGTVRFSVAGQVLLEEHTPGALGNPAGILVEPNPEIVEQATRLLEGIGWTGVANFDLKYDPRDGSTVFFELNPRLGRSNFYLTAAGVNPTTAYVREYVLGQDPVENAEQITPEEHLYSVLPYRLLKRYVLDSDVLARVKYVKRAFRYTNPLVYTREWDPRRWFYVVANQFNQYRKFARHYPVSAQQEARDYADSAR